MKRVLMIAYHYPPVRGSSGVHRTLAFSRHLREHGWEPVILSVNPRAYVSTADDQMGDIPEGAVVKRSFALDAARHLALGGRHFLRTALPDRWSNWSWRGVPDGLKLIAEHDVKAIWSTYPIATAQKIALRLHEKTKLPWIADLRDSMTDESFPPMAQRRAAFLEIEGRLAREADRVVFTAPGAAAMYAERYPNVAKERWAVIENGYDERSFQGAEAQERNDGKLRLVHAGILYPSERDPTAFYGALADLQESGAVSGDTLAIVLRATGHDEHHAKLIEKFGIGDLIELAPSKPYRFALGEMLAADGLLLFQASNCNHQIPAKVYEYIRARRPVLALTDPVGDTAGVVRDAGFDTIAPLDDRAAIRDMLGRFLEDVKAGRATLPTDAVVASHSRAARTERLAKLLDELTA